MGRIRQYRMDERSISREELRSKAANIAAFELLESRVLLDGTPTAVEDLFMNNEVAEDATTAVFLDVLANDTYDAGSVSITSIEPTVNGAHGNVTIGTNENGKLGVFYTPDTNYSGLASFFYTIEDVNGTSTGTAYVQINNVNDAPVAVDDAYTYNMAYSQMSFNVTSNDSDPDTSDTFTITSVTDNDSHSPATITIGEDGKSILYTLKEGAAGFGEHTFTYTIKDAAGLTSTATVTVTEGPAAGNDTYTLEEEEDSENNTLNVLDNDIGDSLQIIGVTEALNGTVEILNDGTQLRYTPNADSYGSDTFTYTVQDANGLQVDARVTILVSNVNDNPTANDDVVAIEDNTSITISPLANDTYEPDPKETLTIVADSFPTETEYATIELVDNTFVYTLKDGVTFPGRDTFTYSISDGNGGTSSATITVAVTPTVVDDNYTGVEGQYPAIVEDSTDNVLDVLANDTDLPADEALTIISTTDALHGTVTIDEFGTQLLYTPEANYFGEDTFTYTVLDNDGLTATATVTIMVTNVNDNPTAVDDTVVLDGDARSVTIYPLDNDSATPDTGETLSLTSTFTVATQGTITKVGNHFVYRLNDGVTFTGRDQFTYTVSDGHGGTATATITIASTPKPVADVLTVNEDSTQNQLDVLENDINLPAGETLTIIDVTAASHGTVTISEDGSHLLYTPTANSYEGDTFTYTVQDEDGLTATATVTVMVNNTPDAPTATNDTFNIDYTTGGTELDVLANDTDIDPVKTLTILEDGFTQGAHGTVSLNEAGDKLVFTPGEGFNGTDTFTYTITDPDGNQATATVTIYMKAGAVTDAAVIDEDSTDPVAIDVLANDIFFTDNGDVTLTSFTQARRGTVTMVEDEDTGYKTFTYSPDANFSGEDVFTYTLQDANGYESTGTVVITVTPENDTPVVSQSLNVDVGVNSAPVVLELDNYFYDPDPQETEDGWVYRFYTNLGYFDVLLYDDITPITVANFQRYADSGAYDNSFIHRSVADFIIQGGGYTYTDGDSYPTDITTYDAIVNEFNLSNIRGTIAMAKLGSDPNSATSQWFINLDDNSSNLDNQNGGFTVFGEVINSGMDIVDIIAALETYDFGSPYDDLPLNNYVDDAGITTDNLVMINSIRTYGGLTYSVVGNSNPNLVTPTIDDGGNLILQFANNNQGGLVTLTIRATDADGAYVDSTMEVFINNRPDLVVSFGKVTMPEYPAVGDRGTVQLIVSNIEPFLASGRINLQLWISSDGDVTDGSGDYLLTTLSNQLINLAKNKSKTFTLTFYAPSNVESGEYSLVAVVDSGKAIPEHYEDNNGAVYDVQTFGFYPSFVDLAGSINSFWYKNNAMTTGDSGYANVTVGNYGNTTATGVVSISLYLTNSKGVTTSDILVGQLNNVNLNLAAGSMKNLRVQFAINSTVSQDEYWLYAVIDSKNQITEGIDSDLVTALGYDPEGNNNAFTFIYNSKSTAVVPTLTYGGFDVAVQLPDLRVRVYQTNLSYAPLPGETAWARLLISNYSYVRAKGKVNVNLVLRPVGATDTSQDIPLKSINNLGINLNAYASKPILLKFQVPQTTGIGEYQLVATVTPATNSLQESTANAKNNTSKYGSYQVQEAFVDLTPSITKRVIKNSYSTAGDRIFVQVTITNKGNVVVNAKGVVVNLWACTTKTLDDANAEKYLLATLTTNVALRPDKYTRRNFSFVLPGLNQLPSDDYYLIAEVDANDQVVEGTNSYNGENNNTTYVTNGLRVGLPNLTGAIQNITLPTNVISGTKGKAVIKVTNNGNVVAKGRYSVTLYARPEGSSNGSNDIEIGKASNLSLNLKPTKSTNVTVAIDTDILSGNYTIVAVVDSGAVISELGESDNTSYSNSMYTILPGYKNLTGTLGTPVVANPALPGAQIKIPLTIKNSGNQTIKDRIDITFYVNIGGVNRAIGTLSNYAISLAPGKTVALTYTSNLPADITSTQSYNVEVLIDSGNDVTEEMVNYDAEADNMIVSNQKFVVNQAFINLNGTLQAPVVANPATGNDSLKTTIQLSNAGNIKYTGTVLATFKTDTGVVLGTKNIALSLNPGQSTNVTHTMTLPTDLAAGAYDVVVEITQAQPNAVVTVNVNDDAGLDALTIGSPNLTGAILGTTIDATEVTNTNQSAQIRITNNGNVRSQGQADVQLWATSDGVIDGVGDYLLTSLTNQEFNLAAGAGSTHTLNNFTLPADMDTSKTYQLATVITPTAGLFNEATADNTTIAPATFNVEEGRIDLSVTANWNQGIYGGDNNPATADNIFLRGQTYTMTVSVTNTGNIAATDFNTKLQALNYFDTVWHNYKNPVTLGTLHIDSLAAGENFTGTLTFMFSTDLPATQTYDVIIVTDADGVIAETNEGNNQAAPDGLSGNNTYYFAV